MNLQESIKKILNEMNKEVLWLRRRLNSPEITEDMYVTVHKTIDSTDPCDYKTSDDYFDEVMEVSLTKFVNHWEELYDTEDFLSIDDFVYEIIYDKYGDKIRKVYESKICD